jgi:precorrin-6B methylase 1
VKQYQYLSANNIKDLMINILESLLYSEERKRGGTSGCRYYHEIQTKLTNQLVKVVAVLICQPAV